MARGQVASARLDVSRDGCARDGAPGAPAVASALTLTAIHVSLALTWHLMWAMAGGTLSETLSRPRPRRILEGISGVALLGLALKLAL